MKSPPFDWKERYKDKIATPEAAIAAIPRGRRILIGSGAAEPNVLAQSLCAYGAHLADNEIVHLLTLGKAPYVEPGMEGRFRHTAFFIGSNVRKAVQEGRADFMPVFLSEIPMLIQSRRVRVDVALIQVSEPDRHGFVSLGVSVDIVRAAVDSADLVIAEVNPNMPRTYGDSFLPVDRIKHLVPVDYGLPEREVEPLDDVDRAIGKHVASLVPDRATLQMGIGKIPDAVLEALTERSDLGVHTEMFSDGVKKLVEKGIITGRAKTVLPGKIVTSFIMGSRDLYAWVNKNPLVEMRPSQFTNDPTVIARNDRMIAINSALAVDLTGQVAADTLLGRFFSGIGGQVDFIRGAAKSRGGKPIIALPSTAKNGTLSRIRPVFEEGAGVVTSRGDVHYIVTEFGVADLWGKNIRQRALALIEIAHPDFRSDLMAAAKARKYVTFDQAVPRREYPWEEAVVDELRSGEQILVRPARLSDEQPLTDMFYRLSDESTYLRFFGYKRYHPHDEMQKLVDLDYEANMAFVAETAGDQPQIIGMVRYDVDPATHLADIAFVVRDEWQNKGLGTLLMRRMTEVARERGLNGFTADVLSTNHGMLGIFHKSGLFVHTERRGNVYHLVATFDADDPHIQRV
ncbi:MAG: GNAT family N-acetyltransferase [Polyangiaceae bacterium]|nr:GNAT family N-acetyltransferase [Polyangiaceae bacterium]